MLYSCAPARSGSATSGHRKVVKRGSSSLTVDIHCHVITPPAEDLVRPFYKPETDALLQYANDLTREVNRQQVINTREKITSVERRLKEMDRMGIDYQAVSTGPPQYYYWTEPELGLETSRLINDNIASMVAQHPDRFVGLATLPMQAPKLAVAELERAVRKLDLRGVEISTNVNGIDLSDPRFEPVFAKIEELGIIVFLHPNGFSEARRLTDHYFNNVIGNPLDTTVALSHLIFGGVLDRHPRLKVVAAHGGGYLGSYPFRMDHAHGARPDCHVNIRRKPTSYLKKQVWFDTIVWDHRALRHLVELWGAGRIVAGTDYPYDMGYYDPCGFVDGAKFLSKDERAAIKGLNAAKLLGIKPRRR